jgi:hypothetical protein
MNDLDQQQQMVSADEICSLDRYFFQRKRVKNENEIKIQKPQYHSQDIYIKE